MGCDAEVGPSKGQASDLGGVGIGGGGHPGIPIILVASNFSEIESKHCFKD